MTRRRAIAVLGGRPGNAGADVLRLAEMIGKELAKRGYGVVSGGEGGVAAAANAGCRAVGGDTLALLKWNRLSDAEDGTTWALPTSMDLARSNILNWCGDGMIAFEGRYGTLTEIGLALDTGRPLLVLGHHPFLTAEAFEAPTCRVVPDPRPEDAAELVDLLETLIANGEQASVRPGAAIVEDDRADASGIGLRRAIPGDLELFRRAFGDADVLAWRALEPTDGALSQFQHERCLVMLERGRPVGFLEYRTEADPELDHLLDHIQVNAVVVADAADRGRSVGTRALRLFAGSVFAAGRHRVTAAPPPGNRAAVRCLEKVGFQQVGLMRAYERHRGSWRDALLMDLVPGDLAGRTPGPPETEVGHGQQDRF
ncbi:GNAT family N-acetyltransferase [Streptomyces sp. I05A-00742]|uniref:GNAT family N-acetyltransferase n=1 Tax=Streptomyces sp. I05A-00742 TaxID=2732853 RepID=UPI001489EF87|nr:GNAT family N-acetyltransferase [Streptomyces sp. I05A-00742]